VLLNLGELEAASRMCAHAGAWLVVDNTYEHFTYDGAEHHCVSGDHVINLFSFSKVPKSCCLAILDVQDTLIRTR
jgi:aspartate/methionine/tyrosine aminotransferase